MKKLVAGLVAGTVLGSTGVVAAATQTSHAKAYTVVAGQSVTFAGLTCTAYKGTTKDNANLVCLRNDLAGFGVVVSRATVVVARRTQQGKVKVVFKAANR